MSEKIRITLKDITIECSKEEAIEILNGNKIPDGMYYSESQKKLVKISEMTVNHLRNALNKSAVKYYTDLSSNKLAISNEEYITKFLGLAENPIIIDLFTELQKKI